MTLQDQIREFLNYNPETGEFVWRIYRSPKTHAGKVAGYINAEGYRCIAVAGKLRPGQRLAWIYMYGEIPEGMWVDHINGDRSDNRLVNLRVCTPAENQRNRKTHTVGKHSSKWKGVHWTKWGWVARIGVTENGKFRRYALGTFGDEREAAEAYMFAALALHGDFARLQ